MSNSVPLFHRRKWVFMVYMAGDNNLEKFGMQDLKEMKKVGSSPEVAVVAQFDRMSDQVTRRYALHKEGNLASDIVTELPELNTGDPANLVDFFKWAWDTYPAERTALILWNHGSGWKDDDIYQAVQRSGENIQPTYVRGVSASRRNRTLFRKSLEQLLVEASQRAILFDDTSADFLDNRELSQALLTVVQYSGRPLDLIGFDACLMNMLEIGYQIKDTCQVMVGSQDVEPGEGWPYSAVLSQLNQEPDMMPDTLGKHIVSEYDAYYRKTFPAVPVTQSAIHLPSVTRLGRAVHKLGGCLTAALDERIVLGTVFIALRSSQSFRDRDYLDLLSFCEQLVESFSGKVDEAQVEIVLAAQAVLDLFSEKPGPILAEAHQGENVKSAHGISIYLPVRSLSPLYDLLSFASDGKWPDFLAALVNSR